MKGKFFPTHPEKYMGNAGNIIFRSSWELYLLKLLDSNPAIVKYASEEIAIPYVSPLDGKVHRYYPDFLVYYKTTQGTLKRELLEIKPFKETRVTAKSSEADRKTVAVNMAKWDAAQKFCRMNDIEFRILTEKTLFPKKGAK